MAVAGLAVLAASQCGQALTPTNGAGSPLDAAGVSSPLAAGTGLVILAALAAMGLLRLIRLSGQRGLVATRPLVPLAAVLLAFQLAILCVQVTGTALIAGHGSGSVPELASTVIGQLPTAAVAAIALSWLFASLEAVAATVTIQRVPHPPLGAVPLVAMLLTGRDETAPIAACAPAALVKRGPPPASTLS